MQAKARPIVPRPEDRHRGRVLEVLDAAPGERTLGADDLAALRWLARTHAALLAACELQAARDRYLRGRDCASEYLLALRRAGYDAPDIAGSAPFVAWVAGRALQAATGGTPPHQKKGVASDGR